MLGLYRQKTHSLYFHDPVASEFRDSVLIDSEVNVANCILIVSTMCGSSIDILALYGNGDKWYRCLVIDGITYLTDFCMYFVENTRYCSEFIHL
jgi:hypothetical protein